MSSIQTAGPPSTIHHATHWKHLWKKRIVIWARWAHIYVSMASFAILLFFAVTGLTLNHQDWFTDQQRTRVYKGSVDRSWLGGQIDKFHLAEHLRKAHGIKAALSEVRADNGQVSLSFKGPGYAADAFVDRATGSYEVTETRMGWGAVINDLHKGRDTGRIWATLIDASAIFMTVVSITGLALILFLVKRRRSGLILLGVGAAACYALYLIFVP